MVVSSSILLNACAAPEVADDTGQDLDYNGSDCISIRTIRDYESLDDRNLLLHAGGKRTYFVTLAVPSFRAQSSFRMGFESRDSWLCPYGGDRINFGGISDIGVSIRAISRVSEEQAEELLIRYGRKRPKEQNDPTPVELEGAQIEELG